jgi:hypothetical protein
MGCHIRRLADLFFEKLQFDARRIPDLIVLAK